MNDKDETISVLKLSIRALNDTRAYDNLGQADFEAMEALKATEGECECGECQKVIRNELVLERYRTLVPYLADAFVFALETLGDAETLSTLKAAQAAMPMREPCECEECKGDEPDDEE